MTKKDWFGRPDLVAELDQIFHSDVVIKAISVVEHIGSPRQVIPAGYTNLIENNAILNAKREGYYECLRNLQSLTKPLPEKKTRSDKPWGHFADFENAE